jgi:hypothetical protein
MNLRFQRVAAVALVLAGACSSDSDPSAAPGDGANTMPGAGTAGSASGAPTTPGQSGAIPGQGTSPPVTTPQAGSSGQMSNPKPVEPDPGAAGVDTKDPTTPFEMLPASCKGFEVKGLEHSPGGSVLPNKCAPFHSIRNNPFAIRCIDADDGYDSGFPGDEFCILAPDPANGTQVYVGPESYDNPATSFIMEKGEEVTDYYYTNAPNTEPHFFFRTNIRMRAGSHHMINNMMDADRADGFATTGDIGGGLGGGSSSRSFPGAQRPDSDRPQGTFEVPPENAGLGDELLTKQQFSLNLHHFNLSDAPILREIWINIWYKPESEVKEKIAGIAMFGNPADVSVPAGQARNLHYKCNVAGNTRIITLNGHRHAHTTRFGVWLIRGGENIPIYESFYYNDMPTFQYDSISKNPTPDIANKIDGAFTGLLEVKAGDELHFECDINNDSAQPLRFANEVQTGEMCILFGSRVGSPLCGMGTRVQ